MLLIMAIGYANNLLYFFVFMLISMALTGMWLTNKNVEALQVTSLATEGFHAGEDNELAITVTNQDKKLVLWDLEIRFSNEHEKAGEVFASEVQFEKKYFLPWTPSMRGAQQIPRLRIESRFPFKMLRAWKYYDESTQVIVYPQRKGIDRIPELQGRQSENEAQAQAHEEGLFRDFRDFQKSDPPQRIDWKRSLKHQKHLVKNFETSGENKVRLDWQQTDFIADFEQRISQLAHWIHLCQQRNELYSLKINKDETEFSSSTAHHQFCMQKLALLRREDVL